MENVFNTLTVYGESWEVVSERPFNSAELDAIKEAQVTEGTWGKSLCFFMKRGGTTYIPISDRGQMPAVGTKVDLANCTYVRLTRDGEFCNKVVIRA